MNPDLETRCLVCGRRQAFCLETMACPSCEGNMEVVLDLESARRAFTREALAADPDRSLWRYRALLPLARQSARPALQLGWTPLVPAPALAGALGMNGALWLKEEGRNPSGSLKDRASAMVLQGARAAGKETVVGASTGNAGSSMACLCASVGQRCVIFVPAAAPVAKVAQLLAFGARVVPVRGTYDQAFDLSLEVGRRLGWYSRSTGFNPLTREGKKTCALEIWEQLGFRVPDWVFVSVGDGNIISGLHKGFSELLALGLVERLPRLCAVQSDRSAAVALAVERLGHAPGVPAKIEVLPVRATTVADSISVDQPRDGVAAVRAVLESAGAAVQVPDEQILAAIPLLASGSGIFGEPAGAAALAGLQEARRRGLVADGAEVVCVITGNGLKDVQGAMKAVKTPEAVDPEIEGVMKLLAREVCQTMRGGETR